MSFNCYEETVKWLLQNSSSLMKETFMMILVAAEKGHLKIVEWLIDSMAFET